MTVPLESTLSLQENILLRELGDETILLNIEAGLYFSLDPIGTRMLSLASETDSIQLAFEQLLEEYDVPEEVLRRDLAVLIEELVRANLIRLESANDPSASSPRPVGESPTRSCPSDSPPG